MISGVTSGLLRGKCTVDSPRVAEESHLRGVRFSGLWIEFSSICVEFASENVPRIVDGELGGGFSCMHPDLVFLVSPVQSGGLVSIPVDLPCNGSRMFISFCRVENLSTSLSSNFLKVAFVLGIN